METPAANVSPQHLPVEETVLGVLFALSVSHLINDTL